MPITMEDVRSQLEPDEPNYRTAAAILGGEAGPFLHALIAANDPLLAAKAISLAGMIGDPESLAAIDLAAESPDPALRVAAAATARQIPSDRAETITTRLLSDPDPGVRKVAVLAAKSTPTETIRQSIDRIARTDKVPALRDMAASAAEEMRHR